MSFVAAALTARVLGPRVAPETLLGGGLTFVAAGLALMTLVRHDPEKPSALLPGMMLAGFGWGMVNVTATELALAAVEPARAGMATGTLNVLRQIGLAAGIAALGAIFQSTAGGGLGGASADAFLVGAVVTGVGALGVGVLAGVTLGERLSAPVAAHLADQPEPT